MGYIIGGANLANPDRPTIGCQTETAAEALLRISELEAEGYTVRISTSEGDEVSLAQVRAQAALAPLG